jgi:hypothetical protein
LSFINEFIGNGWESLENCKLKILAYSESRILLVAVSGAGLEAFLQDATKSQWRIGCIPI